MHHGIGHMVGYLPPDIRPRDPSSLLLTSGGHHCIPVQMCLLEELAASLTPPPLVLTSSGSHQNTYSWKAVGTHPTGMLSCQYYCPIQCFMGKLCMTLLAIIVKTCVHNVQNFLVL